MDSKAVLETGQTKIRDPEIQKGLEKGAEEKLYSAGRVLVDKFLKDYPGDLPDAIIFPDTAARPLFYLLRRVLERVSAQRGVPLPRAYFFAIVIDPHLSGAYGQAEIPNNYTKEDRTKLMADRQVWGERAKQILEDLVKRGITNPKIIIFDEQVAEERTKREIDLAFGRKLPLYAFLYLDRALETENPKDDVRGGELGGIELRKVYERGIGVFKKTGSPLSERDPNSTWEKRVELRKAMSQIGDKIADDLGLKSRSDVGH